MQNYLLIFIGSGLGGCLRYLLSKIIQENIPFKFPLGTLIVNVLACLLLGLVWSYAQKYEADNTRITLLLITGFCGGFSTFSTFSNETLQLFQTQETMYAFLNIFGSVGSCLLAVFIGMILGRWALEGI